VIEITDDENTAPAPEPVPDTPASPEKKARVRRKKVPSQKAADAVNGKGNGADDTSEAEVSVEELVTRYNRLGSVAEDLGIEGIEPVNSFDSVKLGLAACERLQNQIDKARDPERKAMRKTSKVRGGKAKKAEKKTARKAVASARGPRLKWEDDDKIVWAGKNNPFREGSSAYDRVKVVQGYNGKSFKFFKAGAVDKKTVKGSTLNTCVKMGLVKKG
jgi:hypothetical protein